MTPEAAADLAARTLAVIGHPTEDDWDTVPPSHAAADRERVASDLAGLRLLWSLYEGERLSWMQWEPLHTLFVDGLRRTARLYGVEP